jgi:predicted enzyme related to lactoylglutathione lyase
MFKLPGYVGGEPQQPVPRDVVAGMTALPPDAPRPHWQIDFWVDDVDETVSRAEERGGYAAVPAFDADFFRQAVLVDPAGAAFSVTKINVG